ncbi:MAG: hypothetical protein AAGA48_12595, partial [Myxococcota bacterium]
MTDVPIVHDAFVGRADELQAVESALAGGVRLVTLLGMGGTGKTRLALEFAGRLSPPPLFVDLSSCESDDDCTATFAAALEPWAPIAHADDIGPTLKACELSVVVLDAFEGIAAFAAPRLRGWMGEAPNVRFVVTSREPLDLRGERQILIGPLNPAESLHLLSQRAQDVDYRFDPTAHTDVLAQIVERLEGLPLAIELAANRLQTLSPPQLLARLDDRLAVLKTNRSHLPTRHAALEATLDDAWTQLSPDDRAALAATTVFPAPFTIEAAEAVLQSVDQPALDRIQRLVARGLLRVVTPPKGERRLAMLEVVREYADRKLEPDARATLQARHAAHYLDLIADLLTVDGFAQRLHQGVESALLPEAAHLEGVVARDGLPVSQRIDATIATVIILGDVGPAARLARSLALAQSLADQATPHQAARLSFVTLYAARFHGIDPPSLPRLVGDFEVWRKEGDDSWAALFAKAISDHPAIDSRETPHWVHRASELGAAAKTPWLGAVLQEGPAGLRSARGTYAEAFDAANEMVQLAEQLGHPRFLRVWLNHRSVMWFEQGHLNEALADVARVEELTEANGQSLSLSLLTNKVEYLYAAGRHEEAHATIQMARTFEQRTGKRASSLAGLPRAEALLALAEGRVDDAEAMMSAPNLRQRVREPGLMDSIAQSSLAITALLRGDPKTARDRLDRAIHLQVPLRQERTDLCLDLGLRALAHARLGLRAEAEEDHAAALEEAQRWQGRRFDLTLAALQAAIDVRFETPGARQLAHGLLEPFSRTEVPQYAELHIAMALLRGELGALPGDAVLRLGSDLSWVQVEGRERVPLERRPVSRSLLTALVNARR